MTFHIAFRTTLLTGCDRFNHFLQLTPLLELEKVFGSRLTGRETFPFVSKKKKCKRLPEGTHSGNSVGIATNLTAVEPLTITVGNTGPSSSRLKHAPRTLQQA